MLFNSYTFIFGFLPVVVAAYWIVFRRFGCHAANVLLMVSSIVYYASFSPKALLTLIPLILLNHMIAHKILLASESRRRTANWLLAIGVSINLALLGYFKYKDFFVDSINAIFSLDMDARRVIFPLGLSFIVFQQIAYLADAHAQRIKSVRIVDSLLLSLFFPKVLAGPIVHHGEILTQLHGSSKARDVVLDIGVGGVLFSMGLFKKVAIADNLAPLVAGVFDASPEVSPVSLIEAWPAVLAYALQLYFDFSGYSDMATGVARMLGVRLPMNFNSPYKSTSIVEFWSRWHITLTRFLTDYIYTPLVMRWTRARINSGKSVLRGHRSSGSAIATLVAGPTIITMLISGVWHGAGWQFVIWGLLHGIFLVVNQTWRVVRPRFWRNEVIYERVMQPVGFVLTLSCVLVAFVFFRAPSIDSALSILRSMGGLNGALPLFVQVVQRDGFEVPWGTLEHMLSPYKWIPPLFLTVHFLPNSIEWLRRYSPALDFPMRNDSSVAQGSFLNAAMAMVAGCMFAIALGGIAADQAFLYLEF